MSDCSGMINKTCLSKTFYMYIRLSNFCDQSTGQAVSVAEFLPMCFETALFETPVVLTTMKIGTVAAFLWLIASLSVQSGMYQLIEKLLAYLSIILHVSFLTLSIYFPNVSIHLSICLSLFTTVCGSGN